MFAQVQPLPPRLSTRLHLALFGDQKFDSVQQLQAIRKKLITEIDNSDVTKPLLLDTFLQPNMHADVVQRVRRSYMSFLKEITTVEAGNTHPNAAKTMYAILMRHYVPATDSALSERVSAAHKEANSYFGNISDTQFETLWKLAEELRPFSLKNEEDSKSAVMFGHDLTFEKPSYGAPAAFSPFETLHHRLDVFAAIAPAGSPAVSATATAGKKTTSNTVGKHSDSKTTTKPATLSPAEAKKAESRQWLLRQCEAHLTSNSDSVFDASQLADEIIKAADQAAGDEGLLQMALFDLIGEAGFELMLELVQHRERLTGLGSVQSTIDANAGNSTAPADATLSVANDQNVGNTITAADYGYSDMDGADWESMEYLDSLEYSQSAPEENLSANQRRKRELKAAREQERLIQEYGAYPSNHPNNPSSTDWLQQLGFGDDYLMAERALGLQKDRAPHAIPDNWVNNLAAEGSTVIHEKRGLPAGTERFVHQGYEEVNIPAAVRPDSVKEQPLIDIASSLEPWAQKAFLGTKTLNTIQSKVFPTAYHSFENMLVCAPTGAGKTNVAMLTLLQLINQYRDPRTGIIDKANIKAVYIAPMKALAQEVVTKFAERLNPLGLIVREFTGDMQLTKREIEESQLLVCTPEKYDVVTRKGGDKSLGTLVTLLIIDEVHLLADERGAVIETIVARTQRYVESSQKLVRIVGLSATLPNYLDVAAFLRVNPRTGLHYFGSEYRPIPLSQTFLGVTEKQRVKRNDMMNKLAYDKMVEALKKGKQVMIFVHARKETVKTAECMADLSGKYCTTDLLQNFEHEKYTLWKKQVDKSRAKEVQQLFAKGLGVHHAGMLRSDRTMTEQLFEQGLIKVLCCTATLAWGINLPAHTVIIKGTELYDPERGGFVDLSILDVLQIFGRAGRPQFDTSGHAVLITPHKSLSSYLGMLTNQAPIESALIKALADHLNAEIVNGTVNNIKEAASWLSYTFLFVRMCKNPLVYGIEHDTLYSDPQLENKRLQLVRDAADILDSCMMCRFDKRSGNLAVTNLGRIASHYYIKHGTIEAFNTMLSPHLSDVDALHVLCSSAEFDQLKVRPEELSELDTLKKSTTIDIRTSTDDTSGKVSVLLQGYLNKNNVSSFTLQSDTNYVAQNAGRITRALFEICLKRGWSNMAGHYLALCKSIDRRMQPSQSPLRQFNELPREVIEKIETAHATPDRLLDMNSREVGQLIHNQKLGGKVSQLVQYLPHLSVGTFIQPITRGILRLVLTLGIDFEWNDRYHGSAEAFWIWVEDGENEYIYHAEHILITKKESHAPREIEVTIPVREPLPPQYYVRVVSDTWVGCESVATVSFQDLILPTMEPTHTDLLDIHPVPVKALKNPQFEALYPFSHFNPIQSQIFHVLYHTNNNVLVGAPTGSGKTITGELAILKLLRDSPGAKTIYVAPLKALARERLQDWNRKFGTQGGGTYGTNNTSRKGPGLGLRILELTGDVTPSMEELNRSDILIVTPEKWDSISRGWQKRGYVQKVQLVIIDEIHLLGVDRGPVLEVLVSRMRFISTQTASPIRFVGLSTALANPRDLADWLGIGDVGVYNFRSSVRPVPLTSHIQGYPGKNYCPRMATMNKPCYAAILEHSPTKPALIFVSSRRQTRLTALNLIAYCASDDNPKQFLHMSEEEIEAIAATLQDRALRDTIVFGVALHHAGLHAHDRKTVEELFYQGKLQVLVCTSTLAWGVNLPCHLVIVKGTEFFDAKQCKYVDMPVTDVLQMMGRAGRPQFDDTGVACIFVHEPKKTFYKKFLHEPFPVESSLHVQLHDHLNAEIASGSLHTVRDCIEYLSWTYYFRRLMMNPAYYGLVAEAGGNHAALNDISAEAIEQHLVNLIASVSTELHAAGCIEIEDGEVDVTALTAASVTSKLANNQAFSSTYLGKIASLYYLNHKTVGMVRERLFDIDDLDFEFALTALHTNGGHPNNNSNNNNKDRGKDAHSAQVRARLHIWQLLMVLCDAPEFAELPVRHCEDELNAQLTRELTELQRDNINDPQSLFGFFSQHSEFGSAHGKAFLLLLAHFEGAPLPISDYINDTKMVQDQVTRVLKAMVDIAAEEGLFDIVLRLCYLSQLLVQGITQRENELCQLPSVDSTVAAAMQHRGITSVQQLKQMNPEKLRKLSADCLFSTSGSASAAAEGVVGSNKGGRAGRGTARGNDNNRRNENNHNSGSSDYENSIKVSEFLRVVRDLPDLEVRTVCVRAQQDTDFTYAVSATTAGTGTPAVATPVLVLVHGETYEVEVQVKVRSDNNAVTDSNNRSRSAGGGRNNHNGKSVFTKKPHKTKAASWYLVAGLLDATSSLNPGQSNNRGNNNVVNNPLRNVYQANVRRDGVIDTRGELLALKQVSLSGSNAVGSEDEVTLTVTFTVPDAEESATSGGAGAGTAGSGSGKALSLVLACDAILGVDVAVSIPVVCSI